MDGPTPYRDLNALLATFARGIESALGDNLCGAYLVGSFAAGGADQHSDVDFIVAVHRPLTESEQPALQALHGRIFDTPVEWAQHFEGSYAPTDVLRRVDPTRRPFFFLDNGARELVWDNHCNTAVGRWTLNRHGIALCGPSAGEIVDPVSPYELRLESLDMMRDYARWAWEIRDSYIAGETQAFNRWAQPYLVLTSCRILHTLTNGIVVSKQEAGEWAKEALDARWTGLIQKALRDRPDPSRRWHQAAAAEAVTDTVAFVESALGTAEARNFR